MGTKHTFHPNLDQIKSGNRSIIVCIDGTWKDPEDADQVTDLPYLTDCTNVRRLHDAILRDGENQLPIYVSSKASTEQNGLLGQILGGALGSAATRIRDEAYVTLVLNYRPGDRVFIFGFGRGAAIARMLAKTIEEEGIPYSINYSKDDTGRIVSFDPICPVKGQPRKEAAVPKVEIEMLGLWDTVGSFEVPEGILGIPFRRVELLKDWTISPNVKKAYHLVAIDEKRHVLSPSLINRAPSRVDEVWFIGVHGAVGGGYNNRRLSDITLEYMVQKAQDHGILFHKDSLEEIQPNPEGLGILSCEQVGRPKIADRNIGVSVDGKIVRKLKPRIHYTVFERMKRKPEYQPQNVLDLKGNYEVVFPRDGNVSRTGKTRK